MSIPRDLIQYISDFCDTQTSISISILNKNLNERINIFRIDKSLKNLLTDEILKQKKYVRIHKLNARDNPKITQLNYMFELKCQRKSSIDDASIAFKFS